jgi:lysophospholipase L1-like esterase
MSGNSDEKTVTSPAPSRGKRLLQNLALSLATFVLCLVAFEIILRLAGYGGVEIYQPDPRVYWLLKPNQDCYTKIGHKPSHINSQGTRGPEFQTRKPAKTIRILSLGDSRTYGWGLADDETYSYRLQVLLQNYVPKGKQVEVINAGVDAWSYPQMWVYFRDIGLKYQPDIVVLAGANLWTQFTGHNSPAFVRKFMWAVRLKNFLRRFAIYNYLVEVKLQKYYQRYKSRFVPVDPSQDPLFKAEQREHPYALFRSAIENLCALAQTNGIKPVLLYLPQANELGTTNTPVFTVMREVHAQLGAPLVDMAPDVKPEGEVLYLDADPVHFNVRGNELIAGRLFETVTNLLQR